MLTKSNFMKYMECPVGFWMAMHRPELLPEITPDVERLFAMGREVDDLSRKLFHGGIEAEGYNNEGWKNTQKLMASTAQVLFQPTVVAGSLTCRADILERNGSTWILNEVKASTSVQPEHLQDVAFQRLCFENAGIKINRTNLVHINNRYVRRGDIEYEKLFVSEDITDRVLELTDEVKDAIPSALELMSRHEVPDAKLLASCQNPKTCEFLKIYLGSIGQTAEPPQIEEITDTAGIKAKLAELEYPLYFLDYETYAYAIPPFDGTRPYQQIPFQFSLGIKDAPEADTRYVDFLARKYENPIPALLAQLKKNIGDKGSVIVWYEAFEKGRNDEMGIMELEYAEFLRSVNGRVFDLMLLFKLKNQLYTRNAFQNSASLKVVLPILCPELAYDDLAIKEGATASASWPILTGANMSDGERTWLADDMLKYCRRDVEAMVRILEHVEREIKG